MEIIYVLFFAAIAIVIAIGVGLEISKGIDEFILYLLFWLLYIITIITFINIVLVGNYYITMKDKTGPKGRQGEQGDRGNKGDVGLCDVDCRDSICENSLNELILNELNAKNNGVAVKINNVYIKSKVRQMCASDEFKQLVNYNGPLNLINYLKTIWKIWVDLIYNSGGIKYFQTIGAEAEFEWLADNPFDEFKKYDVFYWGMGKQYRPQIIDKCYKSTNGETPDINTSKYIMRTSTTDYYDKIGEYTGGVSFWRAKQFTYQSNVFYPVGDIAIGPSILNASSDKQRTVGTFQIPSNSIGPTRKTILVSGDVKGPIGYNLIWTNNGDRFTNFWIWRPIAPPDFIALGDIVTFSAIKPLKGTDAPIRCVPIDMTKYLPPPATTNKFWNSTRSQYSSVSLLGYMLATDTNSNTPIDATSSNAYNLFRAVIGGNLNIPESDKSGSFYGLDPTKYDSSFKIRGLDSGGDTNPDISNNANMVGKGYLSTPQKDSKYSVMAYINLKNNPILNHIATNTKVECNLIPNAISNAYLIKFNKKCLDYNNSIVSQTECDDLKDTQIFSIIMTGNRKNECRIQHYNSKKYIKYQNSLFTLINNYDNDDNDDNDDTLFMMQ